LSRNAAPRRTEENLSGVKGEVRAKGGSSRVFDIYVWAAPRDLGVEAAGELVRAWEAAGGDPAQAPFEPSTDIGWFHRELVKDLPWLDVTSDAISKPTRLPIILSADDEAPARVIAIGLPDDREARREALAEVYSLATKYDTMVYEPGRGAIHQPNREMAAYASETFWPRAAIRTVAAMAIGVAVAAVAWQAGVPLVSGVIALFALFMIGVFGFTLVAEARKALARRDPPDRPESDTP
jgi:hypothetical protein